MSKIGKLPIPLPAGTTATADHREVTVKGPKGELTFGMLQSTEVSVADNTITVSLAGNSKQARSNWGTMRALLANAVTGVTKGFEKKLILEGVGYKAAKDAAGLTLSLGFSHPVAFPAPKGIEFDVEKNSIVTVRGIDRALVGQVAAELREMKKPEPYKGKGFHYEGEVIRRKAGKKAAATTGAAGS